MSFLPPGVQLLPLDWLAPPYQFYDGDLRVVLQAGDQADRFDWAYARAIATGIGTDLAVIDSESEQEYIKATLNRAVDLDGSYLQNYYIGLFRSPQSQNWFWIDGRLLNDQVADWADDEPGGPSDLSEHVVLWASVFEGESFDVERRFQWDDQGSFHENRSETRAALLELPLRRNGTSGYALIPVPSLSWSEARQFAQSLGGDLATIDGFGEREYLRTLIPEDQVAWVGLTTLTSSSGTNWQWLTEQSTFTHVNWDTEEGWTSSQPTADTVASLDQAGGKFASWPDQPQYAIEWALVEFQLTTASSAAATPTDFGAYVQELTWSSQQNPVQIGSPVKVEMLLNRPLTLNQIVPTEPTLVPIVLSYSVQDPSGHMVSDQAGVLFDGGRRLVFELFPGMADPYSGRDVLISLQQIRLDMDGINSEINDYFDGRQGPVVNLEGSLGSGFYGFDLELGASLPLSADFSLAPATAPAPAQIMSVTPLDADHPQFEPGSHVDLVVEFDKKLVDSRLYNTDLEPSALLVEVDAVTAEALYHAPLMYSDNQSPYQLKHLYRLVRSGTQAAEIEEMTVVGFRDSDSSLYGTNDLNLYYYASNELTGLLDPVVRFDQPNHSPDWSIDLNADGEISALSDALILASYVNGISVDAIPDAIIGASSSRSRTELAQYLEVGVSSGVLDIDGDQLSPTKQDLLMITRYALGTFPGNALLSDLLGTAVSTSDLPAVDAALKSIF